MRGFTAEERRARLAVRHRLVPAARVDDDLVAIARSVVALHATDPGTVVLSAAARMAHPALTPIEHALYEAPSLVRMMAMRRTMFTCAVDDASLLQRSSSDGVAATERKRLVTFVEQHGVAPDGDRWLVDVERKTLAAVAEAGPSAAAELTKAVPELALQVAVNQGKAYAGTVGLSSRVLTVLALEGHLVRTRPRGQWIGSQHRWALLSHHLGTPLADQPRTEAQAELARRWLARFGPATLADLKWWTGWTMGATRAAVAAIDTEDVDLDGAAALVLAGDTEATPAPEPWVALLPCLDPTPMGWQARDWYLGPHKPHVFDRNGNVGATVWVDGRIVGGWAQRKTGEVVFQLLDDIGAERRRMVEEGAAQLETLLGDLRITPRFPAPVDRALSR